MNRNGQNSRGSKTLPIWYYMLSTGMAFASTSPIIFGQDGVYIGNTSLASGMGFIPVTEFKCNQKDIIASWREEKTFPVEQIEDQFGIKMEPDEDTDDERGSSKTTSSTSGDHRTGTVVAGTGSSDTGTGTGTSTGTGSGTDTGTGSSTGTGTNTGTGTGAGYGTSSEGGGTIGDETKSDGVVYDEDLTRTTPEGKTVDFHPEYGPGTGSSSSGSGTATTETGTAQEGPEVLETQIADSSSKSSQ